MNTVSLLLIEKMENTTKKGLSGQVIFFFCTEGDVPAGVQHVGHECDGADAAGRVHHVDHDTREG